MSDLISLVVVDQEPRVDSRLIASQLGVEHKNTRELLQKYQADFAEFGLLPFETEAVKVEGARGTKHEKFALLNEDQSYLLLTYSQNTEQARDLKKRLVRAFGEHRRALAAAQAQPALPPKRVIKTRDDLSFVQRDADRRLCNWAVNHARTTGRDSWHFDAAIGQSYFNEIEELARHDLDEARIALHCALVEGAALNFRPGGYGIEWGFARAIANSLCLEKPKALTGRKAKGAAG